MNMNGLILMALLLLALMPSEAAAKILRAVSSGSLYFRGEIAESPCQVTQKGHQLVTQCFRGGKAAASRTALTVASRQKLPLQSGTVMLERVSIRHNLTIITAVAVYP